MPHVEADLGAATSKVELFVIIEIVILTIITKSSTLDAAAVLYQLCQERFFRQF